MAFKGTHNVQRHGSRVWQQRLRVSPNQKVAAGTLLVTNNQSLKSGENTYLRKNTIHAKIDGTIEIKNKYISIKKT
ncbi:MAG: hypothetical protein ISS45_13770 [Candidatus Omnitrophica bacterium]|nr:hypothetical protein [Candidatus Omnitrophota bacterium]